MPFVDLNTVIVTGTYLMFDESPAIGNVAFSTSRELQALVDSPANQIVIPKVIKANLDSSGHFSLVLPATDDPDLAPTGFTYIVTETIKDATSSPRVYNITLPLASAGGTLDLADVAPAVALPDVSGYVLVTTWAALVVRVDALEALGGLGGGIDGGTP